MLAGWLTIAAHIGVHQNAGAVERLYTVSDGIEMRRINTGISLVDSDSEAHAFHTSPDRAATAVVTRKGDLQRGMIDYELWLFENGAVRKYLAERSQRVPLPGYKVLARFSTRSFEYGIGTIKWAPNSKSLYFIGRGGDGIGQIYRWDLDKESLHQLTRSAEDVHEFSVSENGSVIVFSALAPPPDWTQRNAHGYVLTEEHELESLYIIDPRQVWSCCKVWLLRTKDGATTEIRGITALIPPDIWISPKGRWAITHAEVRTKYPSQWYSYDFVAGGSANAESAQHGQSSDAKQAKQAASLAELPLPLHRFFLVDLSDGAVRPLLDAPIGAEQPEPHVAWALNESRVIVGPTYLPLDIPQSHERNRRMMSQAVAEVEIDSGTVRRITDIADRFSSGRRMRIWEMRIIDDGTVSIGLSEGWPEQRLPLNYFRLVRGKWIRTSQVLSPNRASWPGLEYYIAQSLNTRPEIAVRDTRASQTKIISNLNPALDEVAFGHAAVFKWTDRLGREHEGGLLYPVHHQRDTRYPAVIQTYGFDKNAFLLEGPPLPGKAVFAAQALASAGMIVLQIPIENLTPQAGPVPEPYTDNGEMPRFNAMLEAAIDALDRKGVIDADRIGLTGFSRSTTQVVGALTFGKYTIAAACVADGAPISPYAYAAAENVFKLNAEHEIGAAPWGDGIKLWLERSPAFHYSNIRTPLRMEMYSLWSDQRWDMYSLLRRFRRPVELIHIPDGKHILVSPFAVYTSQQGTVDWYKFWLQNYEDPDARKKEQYVRWRKLRLLHLEHLRQLEREQATRQGLM